MRIFIALLMSVSLAAASPISVLGGSVGAPTTTYLLDEGFEGTGTPSGWGAVGSVDFDYTTSPLVGAQDMRSDVSGEGAYYAGLAKDTLYIKFRYRAPTIGFSALVDIKNAGGGTNIVQILVLPGGALQIECLAGGGAMASTTATLSNATAYDIWVRYTKGTGSNAIARVWFATAGSAKPADGSTSSAGVTNGTGTQQADQITWYSNVTAEFDSVQVAETDF